MKTISRYLMTLVALFAMTTQAWAEEVTVTFTQADLSGNSTVTKDGVTLTPGNGDARIDANFYHRGSNTFSVDKGTFTKIEIVDCNYVYPDIISGWQKEVTGSYQPYPDDDPWPIYTLTWTGEAESVTFTAAIYGIQSIVFTINKPDVDLSVDVTLNEAKTEATMDMPTSDVTIDYELVRDMSIGLIAQVGDGTQEQPRYRVKKEDNVFKPADLSPAQVMALFSVNDQIEQKVLTPTTDYIVNIYAIDEEGQPTGNPMTFADFTFEPGIYAVKAVAAEGSPYDGESALSNKFVLFQGYEVYVPAGEYVTYYRNEALRVDEADKENFKLYTVSSVSGDKATLSNAFDAAPSNTPFLVYNNTNESKTVLLIPCNEPDLALTVADQFLGTMEEKTFTDADMAAADYYVCNGKQFVKVRGAGTLGANKAYLKFVTDQQLSAPQYISISGDLGEGTTRIDNLNVNDNLNDNEATWYDLNGRKLNGKPAQKGIYIKNGKKIVVK